ncbi:MAG: hypothetical protein IT179_01350 [Acidobacteria bacterium]|nr:hypothetical protein [Acidobacteriota bacterium]
MWTGRTSIQGIRRVAAPVLLGVFVVAAQLAPVAHLATHRNDHTHGPELGTLGDADHDAAHRAGLPHAHLDELTADEGAWLDGAEDSAATAGEHAPETGDASPAHSHGAPASHDHGRDSVAHFGVALVEGPPAPLVPPPAETIAPPPDATARDHRAPARPQPPVRGPPA